MFFDFNMSCVLMDATSMRTWPPYFLAPEIMSGNPVRHSIYIYIYQYIYIYIYQYIYIYIYQYIYIYIYINILKIMKYVIKIMKYVL